MTAKLKKELIQQKRSGARSAAEIPRDSFTDVSNTATSSASADSSAGAVDQVEQTTQAAVVEVGSHAKRGVSMAVSKVKQKRQKIKERQGHPTTQGQPPDTLAPIPGGHGADTPAGTSAYPERVGDASATLQVPTPGDRMRQRAMNQRKEQLAHPKTDTVIHERDRTPDPFRIRTQTHGEQTMGTPATPSSPAPGDRMRQRAVDQRKEQLIRHGPDTAIGGETPVSGHYGKPAPTSGPSTKNLPAGDQSIHQSIKERPRRSTVLKEKPQAGAIQPKTCRTVEQAARTRVVPTGTPGPAGKKAPIKHITDRARKKARQEAQRGMLQKSKQAAQATADLSKKAVQSTVKAVKELISALAALVGGGTLAAAMCVIFLVAAVIASPFG